MREYIYIDWSELEVNAIDTQFELEQLIMYKNIISADSIIKCYMRIRSKMAKKWLNHLGYKWKDIQKGIFFYEHEYKDMVEY